jgi:putative exporter of polyketide antibiotics
MACFLVPAGEAIVTTVIQKVVEKRENKAGTISAKWSKRLGWLNIMLWGGTLMLAIDHIISGEIVAYPPFLTALQTPGDTAVMLREMATTGVAMAAAVTAVWGIMVLITEMKSRVTPKAKTQTVN